MAQSPCVLEGNIDVCIVLCGVNDAAGYIGSDFYAFHVVEIAELLRSHGVFPVILEVPEFGIETSSSISWLGAFRRHAMRWVLHGGERDVIPAYRNKLRLALRDRLPTRAYELVSFDPVCTDHTGARDLYTQDLCHLSQAGIARLATVLMKPIGQWRTAAECGNE
jgi:hypothetical protein